METATCEETRDAIRELLMRLTTKERRGTVLLLVHEAIERGDLDLLTRKIISALCVCK
jgi:hypothetical protein